MRITEEALKQVANKRIHALFPQKVRDTACLSDALFKTYFFLSVEAATELWNDFFSQGEYFPELLPLHFLYTLHYYKVYSIQEHTALFWGVSKTSFRDNVLKVTKVLVLNFDIMVRITL